MAETLSRWTVWTIGGNPGTFDSRYSADAWTGVPAMASESARLMSICTPSSIQALARSSDAPAVDAPVIISEVGPRLSTPDYRLSTIDSWGILSAVTRSPHDRLARFLRSDPARRRAPRDCAAGEQSCPATVHARRAVTCRLADVPPRHLGHRVSPLATITTANVSRLTRSWTYSLQAEGSANVNSQATPIVIGGVMYLPAANRVVALDAASGS